ncbi:MAG: hypothetical protein AAF726_08275 [Planctomycetota bacterium]
MQTSTRIVWALVAAVPLLLLPIAGAAVQSDDEAPERPEAPAFVPPPDVAPDVEGGVFTRFFHPDGSVAREGFLVDGVRAGVWHAWSVNGARAESGAYDGYRRVGPWVLYRGSGASARRQGNYDADGLRHGTWATFDEEGNVRLLIEYVHGKRNGTFTRYAPDGRVVATYGYLEDRKHGPSALNARQTDVPLERGSWAQGRRVGEWTFYHREGPPSRVGTFVDGLEEGEWIEYHSNGQRMRVGRYERGQAVGEWRGFYRQGERQFTGKYVGGLTDGMFIEWYPNGVKKAEGSFVKGKLDGKWTFWDRQGRVDEEQTGTYRDGELIR